jgi:hypothetical protein
MKGNTKEEWKYATPSAHRRPKGKSWRKVVGKDSGELGDFKIGDDNGRSDIEVSELSEGKCEEELLDGFEIEGEEKEKEEEGVMGGIASVKLMRNPGMFILTVQR